MGPLILPSDGPIYIDADVLISSIERVAPYAPLLDAFWQEVSVRQLAVTLLDDLLVP